MAFLKLLINIGLIFTAVTTLPIDDDAENESPTVVNYRLPDNVVPIHYDIKLNPHINGDFNFDGESSIKIEIRRATQDLSLHKLDLTINKEMTTLVDDGKVTHRPQAHNYNRVTQILTLKFDNELPPGIYILNIQFAGSLSYDLNGFFRTSYINEHQEKTWLAASHFEPTWARRAFPCWDEPALKATFDISIKHHRNYTALSNMPVREEVDAGEENDMVWTHFDTTPIMSTYLIAFIVADYVRVPNADETVNMWCRAELAPHTKLAQEVAERAGQILTEYTNSTDKVPKMDHASVPRFNAGAMENWGLIIYVEKSFAYREGVDKLDTKMRVASVAAHEMAHQWFGNVVSPSWWSHIWLNEGFASFFQEYVLNEIFEDWRVMDFFVVKVQQQALHIDIAKNMKPITMEVNSPGEIMSLFSYSSYGKAPAILRMCQHMLSEEVFRKGIIRYLHTHEFSSATSDDLWSALQTALDESDPPHDTYKLKEVMNTWIKQRHFPLVHVTRNNVTGEIIITQEHFRPINETQHVDSDKWWIPINFATKTNPDFSNTLPTHWLTPEIESIIISGIDPDDWIIVNIQQMGYYRVNYDNAIWQQIKEYLYSENFTNIHVLNRAQIIDDAYHLMVAQQLDIQTFLEITAYLKQETDYLALYPMFEILEYIENFFKLPNSIIIKVHLLDVFNGILKNIKPPETPGESDLDKIKRAKALKWACTLGDHNCKRFANMRLSDHLANPEEYKVSPDLEEWTYCNGIMLANASVWDQLMDVYATTHKKEILEYLACSEDPEILINYLDIFISKDSRILPKHLYLIIIHVVSKHADKELVLTHILANLEKVFPGDEDAITMPLSGIIDSVYSEERLNQISEFVKNKFPDSEKLLNNVQKYIDIRKSELSDIFAPFRPPIMEE